MVCSQLTPLITLEIFMLQQYHILQDLTTYRSPLLFFNTTVQSFLCLIILQTLLLDVAWIFVIFWLLVVMVTKLLFKLLFTIFLMPYNWTVLFIFRIMWNSSPMSHLRTPQVAILEIEYVNTYFVQCSKWVFVPEHNIYKAAYSIKFTLTQNSVLISSSSSSLLYISIICPS